MIRHAAAAAFVLCICPAWLFAQTPEIVVKTSQANVHRAPTTASPVIDIAPRGAVLDVTRDLGSWVKVSWPDAPDGIGYVHVSRITAAFRTPAPRNSISSRSARAVPESALASSSYRQAIEAVARHGAIDNELDPRHEVSIPADTMYVIPPAHMVGVGGRLNGSTVGYGISARAWPFDRRPYDPRRAGAGKRFGFQIDVSRFAMTNPAIPGRVTSVQFAPSVLYALPDRVTDYIWVRPYVGGGANLQRESVVAGVSETRLGYQGVGGGEFTFASIPRFTVSADAGYRWFREPSTNLDLGGVAFSLAAHWYIK